MNYIASLYSNGVDFDNPIHLHILEKRVKYTMKRVCELMEVGYFPYSPILHCHHMSKEFDLPQEYSFWKECDRNAISHCDKVFVLMMSDSVGDWESSVGITDEIAYANEIGKEVIYLECEDYV